MSVLKRFTNDCFCDITPMIHNGCHYGAGKDSAIKFLGMEFINQKGFNICKIARMYIWTII